MWRCGGRLGNAETPYETKYLIILPKSHPITNLIVKQAHERVLHDGVRETLTEIRSKYWIPRERGVTQKIVHQCVTCRRYEGLPFKAPPPPPLPECRVKESPAFSFTGVDFAGPLIVSTTHHSPEPMKVWIDQSYPSGCCSRQDYPFFYPLFEEICRTKRSSKTLHF